MCLVISLSICYWLQMQSFASCGCVCVYAHVWEREREREGGREGGREREREGHSAALCVCTRVRERGGGGVCRHVERVKAQRCVCVCVCVCERGRHGHITTAACVQTHTSFINVCHATLFPSRDWTDGKTLHLYIYFESWSLNITACQHILLHQIPKIMIFKKASYHPCNAT